MKQVYLSVEALIIVHNILMELNDVPDTQESEERDDPLANLYWLRQEDETEDIW